MGGMAPADFDARPEDGGMADEPGFGGHGAGFIRAHRARCAKGRFATTGIDRHSQRSETGSRRTLVLERLPLVVATAGEAAFHRFRRMAFRPELRPQSNSTSRRP